MFKRILCTALSAVLCASAAAVIPSVSAAEVKSEPVGALDESNFGSENNITLKVWTSESSVSLVKQQVESFKALYPNKTFKKIEVVANGPYDSAILLINNPQSAADVMMVPSDQFDKLRTDGVMSPVKFTNEVKNRDCDFAVKAATYNNTLYAYPESTDNGYYLVYDRNVVTATDAKTLEATLAACKRAGKQFVMDTDNGFYSCIFAFTGGAVIDGFEADGETQKFKNYSEDEAVQTLMAFAKLINDYKGTFISSDPALITSGFQNKTLGAGIDGTWNVKADKAALGSSFGAAKLPTITVNGNKKQIVPMQGLKYEIVNPNTKFPAAAHMLAYYLTDEECQNQNAQQLSYGPSNKALQKSAVVTGDSVMNVMTQQAEFAVPQVNIQGTFWQAMGTLGSQMYKNSAKYADKAFFTNLLKQTVDDVRDEYEYEYNDYPDLYMTEVVENGIRVYWTNDNAYYSFRVFRKEGNSWKAIGNTTAESFIDKNVDYQKTYTYTVRAVDRYGNFESDYDHYGITEVYRPYYNPWVYSLSSNAGGVRIEWYGVDGFSNYRLYYLKSNGSWAVLKNSVKGTTFTDSNVKYGETKTYTVRALDARGRIASGYVYGTWQSIRYGISTPQISGFRSGENGVTVNWKAVNGAAKYRVYCKGSNGKWKSVGSDVKGTSLTDSAVSYKQKKTYTVRAVNNKGEVMSGYNNGGWSTTYYVAAPGITSLKNTKTGVVLKWNKVGDVSGYRIFYKKKNGSWSVLSNSVKGTSFTDKSVKNGEKRTYTIRALNKKGNNISAYNRSGWSITCKK